MATEYRLIVVRPVYEDGQPRERVYKKRDLAHAEQGLKDWVRDMGRYAEAGLVAWPGHIESRDVTPWVRVVAKSPASSVDWGSR